MNKLIEGKTVEQMKALCWDKSIEAGDLQQTAQARINTLNEQIKALKIAIKAEEAK